MSIREDKIMFAYFIGLAILLQAPHARSQSSAVDLVNTGANLVLNYAQAPKSEKSWIKESEISGCCFLRGTTLKLETSDGSPVDEQILITEGFTFRGLKPGRYNLVANHSRYVGVHKMTGLVTGRWTDVDAPATKPASK